MDVVVIDSSVLIGFLDAADPNHALAVGLLRSQVEAGTRLLIPASVYSEILVRPTQREVADQVDAALDGLGIGIVAIDRLTARGAAEIRARSPVRLPDALVLSTAREHEAMLLTLDKRLHRAAESLGIPVPIPDSEPNGNAS